MRNTGLARYQNYLKLLQATIEQREDVKLYLELLLTLIAISFFTLFAIRPTFITIVTLANQIKTQEEIVRHLDEKVTNLSQANKARQQFEKDALLINQAIPDSELPALTSRQIESLARENNVLLNNLSIDKVAPQDENNKAELKTGEILVSGSLAGDPQKVFSFIEKLEKTRRIFLWGTLALTGKPPGASTTIEISFTGTVPFALKKLAIPDGREK